MAERSVEVEDDGGQSSILQWLNDSIDEHILYALTWFNNCQILGSARDKIKGDRVRIISGSRKGHRLVEWEESGIRPMRDFVRSALFNILADLVVNARFLDLFCGTGSVGLEAISRGAWEATFVDRSPKACRIVRRNLDLLGFLDQGSVLERDYAVGIDHLQRRGKRYDLIFVGPPYDKGLADSALKLMAEHSILAKDGLIITEVRNKTHLEDRYGPLERFDKRTYGDNVLDFYSFAESTGSEQDNEEGDEEEK